LVNSYIEHCLSLGKNLAPKTVVVDAAYGAAYAIAPRVLSALGATIVPLHCKPDGRRINVRCGATDLSSLRRAVLAHRGSVGVAFDGDADRALFVDETGEEVSGDHVLAIWANDLLSKDMLPQRTIVATVMSNLGLELAVKKMGCTLVRTAVGDRYVLETMQQGGYRIGGEQSGHLIDLQSNTTGDGIITAVRLLSIAAGDTSLNSLARIMRRYPQILVNVRVADKRCLEKDGVRRTIEATQNALAGRGRVLVRPSGTEPLIRIMLEGPQEEELQRLAALIVEQIDETRPAT
jgi:phosphoglucosamine mutase